VKQNESKCAALKNNIKTQARL